MNNRVTVYFMGMILRAPKENIDDLLDELSDGCHEHFYIHDSKILLVSISGYGEAIRLMGKYSIDYDLIEEEYR